MHDDYDRRYMDALRALTAWRELWPVIATVADDTRRERRAMDARYNVTRYVRADIAPRIGLAVWPARDDDASPYQGARVLCIEHAYIIGAPFHDAYIASADRHVTHGAPCDVCLFLRSHAARVRHDARTSFVAPAFIREWLTTHARVAQAYRDDILHDLRYVIDAGACGQYVWLVDDTHTAIARLADVTTRDDASFSVRYHMANASDSAVVAVVDCDACTYRELARKEWPA